MTRAVLVGNVGATRARFALAVDGRPQSVIELASAEFSELADAISTALGELAPSDASTHTLTSAAIAVAAPVTSDRIELTNVGWRFSIEATRRALALDRLLLINDLAAVAWAVPLLRAESAGQAVEWWGAGRGRGGCSAVVGVGTGLGVATHLATGSPGERERVLDAEGGHRDLAATNEREFRVVERLALRYGGHASVERAVSGAGLAALWSVLAELDGEATAAASSPAAKEVARRARAGEARAQEAVALFSGWLGAFAGDVALTVGAQAGVWIAGGVVPALGSLFDRDRFRHRFGGKGRFRAWLEEIPLFIVADQNVALRGLARWLAL